jgi:hypothetical protein
LTSITRRMLGGEEVDAEAPERHVWSELHAKAAARMCAPATARGSRRPQEYERARRRARCLGEREARARGASHSAATQAAGRWPHELAIGINLYASVTRTSNARHSVARTWDHQDHGCVGVLSGLRETAHNYRNSVIRSCRAHTSLGGNLADPCQNELDAHDALIATLQGLHEELHEPGLAPPDKERILEMIDKCLADIERAKSRLDACRRRHALTIDIGWHADVRAFLVIPGRKKPLSHVQTVDIGLRFPEIPGQFSIADLSIGNETAGGFFRARAHGFNLGEVSEPQDEFGFREMTVTLRVTLEVETETGIPLKPKVAFVAFSDVTISTQTGVANPESRSSELAGSAMNGHGFLGMVGTSALSVESGDELPAGCIVIVAINGPTTATPSTGVPWQIG